MLFLAVMLGLSGCGPSPDEIKVATPGLIVTNVRTRVWRDLPMTSPLVVVGDRVFTKEGLTQVISNEYATLVARGKTPVQARQEVAKRKEDIVSQAVARFIYESSFLLEAEARGLRSDGGQIQAQWAAISNQCEKFKMDAGRFALVMGLGTAENLTNHVEKQVLLKQLFDCVFSNRLEVTDAEVEALVGKLKAKNEESAATNRIFRAEMEQLRERILREKLVFVDDDDANAKLVAEPFKVEWFASAPARAFDDEEVMTGRLRYMSTNVWSEVIDLEDSYDIYLLTQIQQKDADTPTLYTGYRVTLEKDHGWLVPEPQKVKQDLRKRRNLEVVTPESERLRQKFGVVYPNGFVWETMFEQKSTDRKGTKK